MNGNAVVWRHADGDGFSLIELLVVIAILGILAVAVVLSTGGTTIRAKGQACRADRQTLVIALEAYNASYRQYPPSQAALVGSRYLESESTSYDFTTSGSPASGYSISAGSPNPNGCT